MCKFLCVNHSKQKKLFLRGLKPRFDSAPHIRPVQHAAEIIFPFFDSYKCYLFLIYLTFVETVDHCQYNMININGCPASEKNLHINRSASGSFSHFNYTSKRQRRSVTAIFLESQGGKCQSSVKSRTSLVACRGRSFVGVLLSFARRQRFRKTYSISDKVLALRSVYWCR